MIESLTGQGINVQQACIALGVSQSGYYAWKGRPDAPRTLRRIWLGGEIADVHKESGGTYSSLRVTVELTHGRGIAVGQLSPCSGGHSSPLPRPDGTRLPKR